MKPIAIWLEEYGDSHRNRTNKLIHWICVPVIFWTINAMLWSLQPFRIELFSGVNLNLGILSLLFIVVYYALLSVRLASGMLLFSLVCLFASYSAEQVFGQDGMRWFAMGVFVLAWIGQFYGHHVEGKKPSFVKDIQFLMIGPAWLMSFIYRKLGIGL